MNKNDVYITMEVSTKEDYDEYIKLFTTNKFHIDGDEDNENEIYVISIYVENGYDKKQFSDICKLINTLKGE